MSFYIAEALTFENACQLKFTFWAGPTSMTRRDVCVCVCVCVCVWVCVQAGASKRVCMCVCWSVQAGAKQKALRVCVCWRKKQK